MHYTGTIDQSSKTGEKGKQFDSSRLYDRTFKFKLGLDEVIRGWDVGLVNLCKGAKVTLVMSPDYGYGDDGAGIDVPGGATLNFDVEVMDIRDEPQVESHDESEDELDDEPDAEPEIAGPVPNIFRKIDGLGKDGKKDDVLTAEELKAFFKFHDREMPSNLMENEDKNKDGKVSWEEFSGPKGPIIDLEKEVKPLGIQLV